MKMISRSTLLMLLAGITSVFPAVADPILPYQQPIAAQLNADIGATNGNVKNLNKALTTYHKNSKSLSGDITTLRSLNNLLGTTTGYPALLADAAVSYQTNFLGQRDGFVKELIPAPRGATKTEANTMLSKLTKALTNSVAATTTVVRISNLQSAAQKIVPASNSVQRALHAAIGLSSMGARIGELTFNSTKGFVTGGTNFQTTEGDTVGSFKPASLASGTLTVSAIAAGPVVRGITLHVEGITTNVPATYPLAVADNAAFYDATDLARRIEYHFQASSTLTNGTVTNAWLSLDFIGTNYILGRFAFVGTNMFPASATDSNTLVTVSQGEFQLNYRH